MARIAAAHPATALLSSIAKECRLALAGDRHKRDLGVGRLVNAAPAVAIAARINQFGSSPIDSSVPVSFSQTDPSGNPQFLRHIRHHRPIESKRATGH